jgi:acetyltransferase
MFKGGQTTAGAKATLSHTASLAGSQQVFEAMCKQAGIIQSFEALQSFEMAEALAQQPLPKGKRIAIMGSGGQCVVTTDICSQLGMEIPELDEKTVNELQKFMPPHVPPPRNPVDFAGAYRSLDEEISVIEKFLTLDYIDGVITNMPADWNTAVPFENPDDPMALSPGDRKSGEYLASLPQKYGKPVIAVRWARTISKAMEEILIKGGIPIYDTSAQCAYAMYALVKYAEIRRY